MAHYETHTSELQTLRLIDIPNIQNLQTKYRLLHRQEMEENKLIRQFNSCASTRSVIHFAFTRSGI